jgi:hypothetical protein
MGFDAETRVTRESTMAMHRLDSQGVLRLDPLERYLAFRAYGAGVGSRGPACRVMNEVCDVGPVRTAVRQWGDGKLS